MDSGGSEGDDSGSGKSYVERYDNEDENDDHVDVDDCGGEKGGVDWTLDM